MSYQPPQHPYAQPQHPSAPPVPPRRNRIGLIALIVGIVAFIGAFVPLFSYLAVLIALAAVVLGIIALIRPGSKGAAIAGAILGFFALVIASILSIVYTFVFFGHLIGAAGGADGLNGSNGFDGGEGTEIPLVYQVDGTGSDVDISYSAYDDGISVTEQETAQRLPFEEDFDVSFGGADTYNSYTITATNGDNDGDVTCRIILDSRILVEQTASGPYATASCTASGSDLLE
ncbi:hypothetical protein [Herbiconiux liukaitaii]|uniref:hypothetical protein n=1 Tax=Herbiconiux liukaitaii TaxID=3342799 RepID=UPI0035B86FBE